jgi:hypothetical protein
MDEKPTSQPLGLVLLVLEYDSPLLIGVCLKQPGNALLFRANAPKRVVRNGHGAIEREVMSPPPT